MNRIPIRLRLTAAFALAMILVLAGAGLFVSLRLRSDLNEKLGADLQVRASAAAVAAGRGAPRLDASAALAERDESLAQVLTPAGAVIAAAGGTRAAALTPAEARRAARAPLSVERRLGGIDAPVRILAVPAAGGRRVAVAGQSLDDRNDSLANVRRSFLVGGALAVVLASAIGFALASASFAPVEAMRRRAAAVSLRGVAEELPLPAAHDEIRRLGETLNAMLARLRASFQHEREFVADASHELRTPISVIKAEIDNALRDPGLGAHGREALAAASAESDRLAQLADDLLVLARAQDGELPVRAEPVPVGPLLEGVAGSYRRRAAGHGRQIGVESPAGLAAWADPLRLRQAMNNLVDNALRHGDGDVDVRARPERGGVALQVADGGPGFDPATAARAFERFARGDAARGERGSGLGLAIVRTIAEAHGGTAELGPGPGGTVELWLPGAPPG